MLAPEHETLSGGQSDNDRCRLMSDGIPKSLRDRVAAEAGFRCGYCLTDRRVSSTQMHIEHLILHVLKAAARSLQPLAFVRLVQQSISTRFLVGRRPK
jgi:hypothetical protein